MNEEYKRGYSAGYYRGSHGSWPAHKPPSPPNHIVASMIESLSALRDSK